jgi:hypothetical protein
VAGQVGWNGNAAFESDDLVAYTAQALRNVVAVLNEAGALPAPIGCGFEHDMRLESMRPPVIARRARGLVDSELHIGFVGYIGQINCPSLHEWMGAGQPEPSRPPDEDATLEFELARLGCFRGDYQGEIDFAVPDGTRETGGLVIWIDRMTDWTGKQVIAGVARDIFDRLPKDAVMGPHARIGVRRISRPQATGQSARQPTRALLLGRRRSIPRR